VHTPHAAARFLPRTGPGMDFSVRDNSYHRRLAVISTIVVAAMCIAVVAGQRYIHRDDPKMVGWKGEMELLPEITIEPDVVPAEAAPAPRPRKDAQTVQVSTARESEFEVAKPVETPVPRVDEPDITDLQAHGAARAETVPMSRPVSYSETYVILRTVRPRYPEEERKRGIEGSVLVELLVDEQGLVARANALNLVGPVSFQDSALEAARQFVFQPPIIDGEPSTMWIKFVIKFRMTDSLTN
jgi:TonB family protein